MSSKARIQHVEDLILWHGSKGATRAVEAIESLWADGYKNVTVKWDGSPAVIFGRDDTGKFIMTDKSGFTAKGYDGKATSGRALFKMLINRPGAQRDPEGYGAFAKQMGDAFKHFEAAVPKSHRGFFKGDLLYFDKPPKLGGNYVFKPNQVQYAIDMDSPLGKKIGKSVVGVAVHGDISGLNPTDQLFAVPPVSVEQPPADPDDMIGVARSVRDVIEKHGEKIDKLLDPATLKAKKITDFPNVIYKYINQNAASNGEVLGDLEHFIQWMEASNLSQSKKKNMFSHVSDQWHDFSMMWKIIRAVMELKERVILSFDQGISGLGQSINGVAGGEGYVLMDPEGLIKFVSRAGGGFAAVNRANNNPIQEEVEQRHVAVTFGRFNPPTVGHEKLINKVASISDDYLIYASHSNDKKKNPIPYKSKIRFMQEMFPQHADHIVTSEVNNPLAVLVDVFDKGYTHVTFVVGEDRVKMINSITQQYNGVEGKAHGYYQLEIEVVSAGQRDPDAEGVEGMSASKMRAAALEGDFETFKMGMPNGYKGAKKVYLMIRAVMLQERLKEALAQKKPTLAENIKSVIGKLKRLK